LRKGDYRLQSANTWTVLRPDGGGSWDAVASGTPTCTRTIEDESTHWWHLGVRTQLTSDRIDVTAANVDLDPGTYVFAVPGFLPSGEHVMYATPFEVIEIEDVEMTNPTPVPESAPDETAG
jgi:hypothetical protein